MLSIVEHAHYYWSTNLAYLYTCKSKNAYHIKSASWETTVPSETTCLERLSSSGRNSYISVKLNQCHQRQSWPVNYVPHMSNLSVPESQISVLFSLRPAAFELQANLEESALNDPKMTLSPTRWNVPHICVTSIHKSHISLSFTLWSAVFSSAVCYCTTELLSSRRRNSVCPSSIKRVFSETIKRINARFCEKVTIHHISRPFFLRFSKFGF